MVVRNASSRLLAAALCMVSGAFWALPEDVAAQRIYDRGRTDFNYSVHPQLWMANIDGVISVSDVTMAVGADDLEPAFDLGLEAGKGRWRGIATFRSSSLAGPSTLESRGPLDETPVMYDFDVSIGELFAAVEFGSFDTDHALELMGGMRYVKHALDVDVDIGTSVTRESWVEPVAGARYYANMGKLFWTAVDGSIGGFGIGSNIAWHLGATLAVRITRRIDFTLATRYLQTEYDNPDTGYRWDEGVTQGWHLGLRWKG